MFSREYEFLGSSTPATIAWKKKLSLDCEHACGSTFEEKGCHEQQPRIESVERMHTWIINFKKHLGVEYQLRSGMCGWGVSPDSVTRVPSHMDGDLQDTAVFLLRVVACTPPHLQTTRFVIKGVRLPLSTVAGYLKVPRLPLLNGGSSQS